MKTLSEIRKQLTIEQGKERQVQEDLQTNRKEFIQVRKSVHFHEQALTIIQEIGLQTQQQLQYFIGEITSLALESVFPDPYTLKVSFVERRNQTECDLSFVRDSEEISPLDAAGGGTVDIASFSLRVSSWALKQPRYRNTIILDEPLKNLSKEYRELGGLMLREVSRKLGIQFIIVTHEPSLVQYADRGFEISLNRKKESVCTVKEIDHER